MLCIYAYHIKNHKCAFMNMYVWTSGGNSYFTGNIWSRQGFLFSMSANQIFNALIFTSAAFQIGRAAVYSWRKVVAMLKLYIDLYSYTVTQEYSAGKLRYFVTEVGLEMEASRRCRTVPWNPSFAVQYVRRNGCWSYWYCKGYTQSKLWSLGDLWGEGSSTSAFLYPKTLCSVRRRFCPSWKSIWKLGMSIKISPKYAVISSEIPLYIRSKS